MILTDCGLYGLWRCRIGALAQRHEKPGRGELTRDLAQALALAVQPARQPPRLLRRRRPTLVIGLATLLPGADPGAASLATRSAFWNCETAPRIWRISTAVGVSSRKLSGLSTAISAIPRSFRYWCPVSWTIRSRLKREALSTRIVRTPLLWIACSISAKAGRVWIGSAPRTSTS